MPLFIVTELTELSSFASGPVSGILYQTNASFHHICAPTSRDHLYVKEDEPHLGLSGE